MMVNFTNSWPNMVSQHSLRSSRRVTGSNVGFGVVVVVVSSNKVFNHVKHKIIPLKL